MGKLHGWATEWRHLGAVLTQANGPIMVAVTQRSG